MARVAIPACAFLLLATAVARADAPADDVLRLVPEDVGFCFAIHDLRGHAATMEGSPFMKGFAASALGQTIVRCPLVQKLEQARQQLVSGLQIPWPELRDGVLGGEVALAYRPGPPDHPDQEQGAILIRAPDAALLAKFVQRLNDVQIKAGDVIKIEARSSDGVGYHCRVQPGHNQFYYLNGSVLVFTSEEAFLQRILKRVHGPGPDAWSIGKQMRLLGADAGLARLWINPRAFEAALAEKVNQTKGQEAVPLRTVLSYWKALDGIGVSLSLDKRDIVARFGAAFQLERMPAGGRPLIADRGKVSGLWDAFPDDALLATAGHLDTAALNAFLSDFLPEAERLKAAERVKSDAAGLFGNEKGLLPFLGPDWGLCITAGSAEARFPNCLLALRLQTGVDAKKARQNAENTLQTAAQYATVIYNQNANGDQLAVKTDVRDGAEIRYLGGSKLLPAGLQPAFAVKEGYMLVASSPRAIDSFHVPEANRVANFRPGETPIARVGLSGWASFLKEKRTLLSSWLSEAVGLPAAEAERRLAQAVSLLELFTSAELVKTSGPGRIGLTLRLHTAQPLRN
jgi:hypothetical protein